MPPRRYVADSYVQAERSSAQTAAAAAQENLMLLTRLAKNQIELVLPILSEANGTVETDGIGLEWLVIATCRSLERGNFTIIHVSEPGQSQMSMMIDASHPPVTEDAVSLLERVAASAMSTYLIETSIEWGKIDS